MGNQIGFKKERETTATATSSPPPPAVEIENMVEVAKTLVSTLHNLHTRICALEDEVRRLKEAEEEEHSKRHHGGKY